MAWRQLFFFVPAAAGHREREAVHREVSRRLFRQFLPRSFIAVDARTLLSPTGFYFIQFMRLLVTFTASRNSSSLLSVLQIVGRTGGDRRCVPARPLLFRMDAMEPNYKKRHPPHCISTRSIYSPSQSTLHGNGTDTETVQP